MNAVSLVMGLVGVTWLIAFEFSGRESESLIVGGQVWIVGALIVAELS